MTLEQRVESLERQMRLLQNATIQASKNAQPQTEKLDATASKVEEITPTRMSKELYIGDTECIFTNVPQGNITVYFDKPYTVERMTDKVILQFEPLEEVTTITINII